VRYRFGDLELDTTSHGVMRAGQALQVWPKVFDLLQFLFENPNRLLTKQELLDSLWSDSHVSEGSVPWTVLHARRALGQATGDKHPIETVHGRGYRFVAEIEVLPDAPASSRRPPPMAAAVAQAPATHALPFVGREEAMTRLEAGLHEARDAGRGSFCILTGPAGIGKTRCMDELALRAAAAGFVVLAGRSLEDARAPVFWAWRQIVRSVSHERAALAPSADALLARLRDAEREAGSADDAPGSH
jgi:DNA-binding winged helix-turn-helix (wHTH) protein